MDIKDLIAALENVDIVASEEKTHKVKATITESLHLEAVNEAGAADASIEMLELEGTGLILAFNISYMIEALKSLDSEQARISFAGPKSSIIVNAIGEERSTHIIQPYLIRDAR